MQKTYLIAFMCLLVATVKLVAQEGRKCGFDLFYNELLNVNSQVDLESHFQAQVKQRSMQKSNTIVTVPTVVHVIYRTQTQNISNQQINNQINVINNDFRKLNADTINVVSGDSKADLRIEFRLATQDPNGNASTGITKTATNIQNVCDFQNGTYDQVAPAWDRDSYMNIWVCEVGGGIAGFAFPPNTPGVSKGKDGIVIDLSLIHI